MKEPDQGPESMAYVLLLRVLFKEIASKFANEIEERLIHVLRQTQ
jgi:hypothetical protein